MIAHPFTRRPLRLAASACVALVIASAAGAQERTTGGCCTITSIDAEKGLVTAKERSTERTFLFTVSDRSVLASLRVGRPVYANYRTNEVSVDGKKACCAIVGAAVVATRPVAAPIVRPPEPAVVVKEVIAAPIVKPAEPAPAVRQAEPARRVGQSPAPGGIRGTLPELSQLPQLSAGPVQNVQNTTDWRGDPRIVRQFQDPSLKRLDGIGGIRETTSLPQVVTDLLVLHARTLPAEELDSYIVNPKLADEWLRTNPLPPEFVASVHKAALDDGRKKKKGCSTKHISSGCMKNEVEQSVDDLTRVWRTAWDDTADELGRLLGRITDVRACFADRTLTLSDIPVVFAAEPQIPLSFEKDAKSKGASGTVKGTVAVGVPVNADFKAQVKLFYIPCMPFAVRPKSLGASGSMEVGGSFTASVNATGQFDQSFTIPPGGGVQVPIAVLPIALGGIPIAVLDISIFMDGTLEVSGEGTLDGSLKLLAMQKSVFDFDCTGHGCELNQHGVPAPATAIESVKLDGRIKIKPAIYSALQLSLNYDLLSARAGPQPFLLGEIYGCAGASGRQNTAGASSAAQSYALTADLDWGLELRAEALAGGKPVAHKKWEVLSSHIYFKDLAQSTALVPGVAGTRQPSLGQAAAYTTTMPGCYPYPDPIDYKISWTGDATPTTGSASPRATGGRTLAAAAGLVVRTASDNSAPSACTFQAGQGICVSAPLSATSLNLTWPALGDYSLTVTPLTDKHGRKFDASEATTLNIRVQP